MISLGSARELAVEAVQRVQERYKRSYDKHSKQVDYHKGEWIFIYFPAVESGHNCKLSHPWHGPVEWKNPDKSLFSNTKSNSGASTVCLSLLISSGVLMKTSQ